MKEDNNEFENLYKKAAENFPLKTDNADWQSVLSALEEDDKKAPFFINRNVFILGLLLFLVSFLYITTLVSHKNSISNNIAEHKHSITKDEEAKQQNIKLEQEITEAVYKRIYDSLNAQKKPSNSSFINSKKLISANDKNINQVNAKSDDLGNTLNNNNAFSKSKQDKFKTINAKKINTKKASGKIRFEASNQNNNHIATSFDLPQTESIQAFQSKKSKPSSDNNNKETYQLNHIINNTNSDTTFAVKSESMIKPISKTLVADSLIKPVASTSKKSTNSFAKFFYVGVLYAFDNSFEKKEKNPEKGEGASISFLLGYKFSKKISIETGLSFQKKEYYTSANYFNKSILNATGDVDGVEAENRFIEIPLTLKFDWFNKKQHSVFTTIGISSYLVNREKYEFDEDVAGVVNNKTVEFTTVTSNLFATCNFSFGYQFNFKKLGSLRLQPYINLPLKGLGKSQEHLVSKGINIGWIYNFNRK
jgi:hypothetical protein